MITIRGTLAGAAVPLLALLLAGHALAQDEVYQGPSILSRNPSTTGERGGKLIDFRFYGEVTGIYDDGLTPVSVDSSGNVLNPGGQFGLETGFGVIGTRRWKHDKVSLDYHGYYRHYTQNSFYDGTDHFLNFDWDHMLSRHVTLSTTLMAGSLSQTTGAFSYVPLRNTDFFGAPSNELFDNRTSFAQPAMTLVWQKTRRLSFSFGGDGYLVRRRSAALAGMNGYRGRADMAYRLTKTQTVSASYSYTEFDFQRTFGNASLHSVALGYGYGLGRNWDFSTQLGESRVQTSGLNVVTLDPAIAAIVGQSTTTTAFFSTSWIPLLDARLTRRFEHSSLAFDYFIGMSPGDGVYLASRQHTAAATYSYVTTKRATLAATFGYSDLSSLGQNLGKYTNYQGGAGFTYRLIGAVHFELRYDRRHYSTQNNLFKKDENRATFGLAFSPGDSPLPIW